MDVREKRESLPATTRESISLCGYRWSPTPKPAFLFFLISIGMLQLGRYAPYPAGTGNGFFKASQDSPRLAANSLL